MKKVIDMHITRASLAMNESAMKQLLQMVYNLSLEGATHIYFMGKQTPAGDVLCMLGDALKKFSNDVDSGEKQQ